MFSKLSKLQHELSGLAVSHPGLKPWSELGETITEGLIKRLPDIQTITRLRSVGQSEPEPILEDEPMEEAEVNREKEGIPARLI